jgi:hypothetical protein
MRDPQDHETGRRVLVVTLGSQGTSSNLFKEIGRVIGNRADCKEITIQLAGTTFLQRVGSMLMSNIRHIGAVMWAQVVIVHVFALSSVALMMTARLLGRRLVIFQWDIYPTTLAGRPYMTSFTRRFLNRLENWCVQLAHVIVLPSEDFLPWQQSHKTVVFPLWPQTNLRLAPVTRKETPNEVYHIAFAGQINELRGLRECVLHLCEHLVTGQIVLHLFSSDPFDPGQYDSSKLSIQRHEHLPREDLQTHLQKMHFGLVSLNPALDQPGFPSKTFDYLAVGLPILYFGRPLPGYTDSLEEHKVGLDITSFEEIYMSRVYEFLISDFESGRATYLEYARLNFEKISKLL